MKIETVAAGISPCVDLLQCPLCQGKLALEDGRSLVCQQRHTFDLSAKGYINFAPHHDQQREKYDAALFQSRGKVFADGFYEPVADALYQALMRHFPEVEGVVYMADIGCGEGYYARCLHNRNEHICPVGIDLSRDAIVAAARQAPGLPWFIGDLTRLPLADASMDVVLDVLTPADYREFGRVLKPSGLLIKMIPADDYLAEIRQALGARLRNADFSSDRVVAHLQSRAAIVEQQSIRYTLPVNDAQAKCLLDMTPMTFGLAAEAMDDIHLNSITIAMELLVCRLN